MLEGGGEGTSAMPSEQERLGECKIAVQHPVSAEVEEDARQLYLAADETRRGNSVRP